MNDATLEQLKILVGQVVWPIRATLARKRVMREELLAHLVSIFEEEQGRLADEQAALARATQRFGPPGELTAQLQHAVPRWDRCRSTLENLGYRSSEPAWHLAARHFLVMLLVYLLWLPTWMLAFDRLPDMGTVELQRLFAFVLAGAILLAALFNVILSVVLAPLLHKIGPVLLLKRRGRVMLAVLYGAVVLGSLVAPGFIGAAFLFALMARQTLNQWRYQADWA